MNDDTLVGPCHGLTRGRLCTLTNKYGHAIGFAGADKSAVGTINRPLQAFCPRSQCPRYFVNVHYRPLRSSYVFCYWALSPCNRAAAIAS